jgi:hypothetical protein
MSNNYYEGLKSGIENCLISYFEGIKDIDRKVKNKTERAEVSKKLQDISCQQILGMHKLILNLMRNCPDFITPDEYNKLFELIGNCVAKIR